MKIKTNVAKVTLSVALATTLFMSTAPALAVSGDLAGHWAESVITDWQSKGLIQGYADGTFRPDHNVTRAEFVVLMNKAMGFEKKGEISFQDVAPDSWYHDAVAIAVAQGYCSGYADGTFKHSATITRAEAATMLARAKGLPSNEAGAAGFTDMIPAWAKGSVGAVAQAGYMKGYADGTFGASKSITRAEAVVSINKAMGDTAAKKEDVVIQDKGTTLADRMVTGNLIIDKAVGEGEVSVKNTTVKGDLIVNGGGMHSVYLDNVTINGKVIVEKSAVKVQMEGKTSASEVTVNAPCVLTAEKFTGTVPVITISKTLGTKDAVTVKLPVNDININGTAWIDLQNDVKNVRVSQNAANSKITVAKGKQIDALTADGTVTLDGSGKIGKLQANVDGIKVDKNLQINTVSTANGVKNPVADGSGDGGSLGGGGSTPDQTQKPKLMLTRAVGSIENGYPEIPVQLQIYNIQKDTQFKVSLADSVEKPITPCGWAKPMEGIVEANKPTILGYINIAPASEVEQFVTRYLVYQVGDGEWTPFEEFGEVKFKPKQFGYQSGFDDSSTCMQRGHNRIVITIDPDAKGKFMPLKDAISDCFIVQIVDEQSFKETNLTDKTPKITVSDDGKTAWLDYSEQLTALRGFIMSLNIQPEGFADGMVPPSDKIKVSFEERKS